MKAISTLFALSLATAAFTAAGCSNNPSSDEGAAGAPGAVDSHTDHGGHAHPATGPHRGDLIELGAEEYHAELVLPEHHDDDAHQAGGEGGHHGHAHAGITVYVLDNSATKLTPIDAADVTINLTHDGKPEQFKLAAMPTDADPAGKSSRFASDNHDLLERFHESKRIEGSLVLTIHGTSYRGKISHEHERQGHPHGDGDGETSHPKH